MRRMMLGAAIALGFTATGCAQWREYTEPTNRYEDPVRLGSSSPSIYSASDPQTWNGEPKMDNR